MNIFMKFEIYFLSAVMFFIAGSPATGAPANSTYVPAHVVNGKLVPSTEK